MDEGREEDLPDLHRLLVETVRRSGFIPRSLEAYRDVYRAFAPGDWASLLIGRLPDGTAVSSKLILRSGGRDSQLYGGLSDAGAAARAGHFFEWEAIVRRPPDPRGRARRRHGLDRPPEASRRERGARPAAGDNGAGPITGD
jgi:hypothetical protein